MKCGYNTHLLIEYISINVFSNAVTWIVTQDTIKFPDEKNLFMCQKNFYLQKREAGLTACIYYKICLAIIICIEYTIKTAWYMFVQMNNWSTSVYICCMYPFSTICYEASPIAYRILNNWTPEICFLDSHNVIPSAPGSNWIILDMFLNRGFYYTPNTFLVLWWFGRWQQTWLGHSGRTDFTI